MKIIRLRIVLDYQKEDVWCDLSIPDHFKLEQLHRSILAAFALPEGEMASFYRSDEDWNQGEEVSLLDLGPELDNMSNCLVMDFLAEEGQRMIYLYDFLAMWIFFVEVLAVEEGEQNQSRLLLKHGERPDEAPAK